MKKEFICIVCPNSCRIRAEFEGNEIKSIEGAGCPKGKEYVKNEITNPVRVFTGSVLVEKGNFSLLSVKTPSPIPKKYLKNIGEITHQIKVDAPVEIGQVVALNLLNEKIDLVATRKIEKENSMSS